MKKRKLRMLQIIQIFGLIVKMNLLINVALKIAGGGDFFYKNHLLSEEIFVDFLSSGKDYVPVVPQHNKLF